VNIDIHNDHAINISIYSHPLEVGFIYPVIAQTSRIDVDTPTTVRADIEKIIITKIILKLRR